jgi:hypothetical protein
MVAVLDVADELDGLVGRQLAPRQSGRQQETALGQG